MIFNKKKKKEAVQLQGIKTGAVIGGVGGGYLSVLRNKKYASEIDKLKLKLHTSNDEERKIIIVKIAKLLSKMNRTSISSVLVGSTIGGATGHYVAGKSFDKKFSSLNPKFVIHKHSASHLHYDLRLEINGKFVSWAIPKEIVQDSSTKRLAVKVGDHDMKFYNIEGTISKGNYGAGTMMIWDRGTYSSSNAMSMEDQLKEGKITIQLSGTKLKGAWHLFHLKGKGNNWILMKSKDPYDKPTTTVNHNSVVSGRSMDEITNPIK